jgi:hypothetical protein
MRLFLFLILTLGTGRSAEPPPCFVFILADDPGIADIGAYVRHFTEAKPEEL